MRINITERIWRDPEVKNYVMLDVTEDVGGQEAAVIDGTLLLPKDEYHVTLVAAGKIAGDDPRRTGELLQDLEEYLRANPDAVRFERLGDDRYVCRDGEEMTLIAPAEIVGIEGLRRVVTRHVPDYKPAFPHVTLLKNEQSPYGIGVNSTEDFQALCRRYEIG